MDTSKLEKFAQAARRQLREQVAARMEQVLREDSAVLREQTEALTQLKEEIDKSSKQAVIDRAAYTWFNRFVALRYMDVNFYNPVRVVSPQEGYTQPEILQDAKTGVIDESLKVDKRRVKGLLNGEITSPNPQQEVYRLLLLGKCQQLHDDLPFLFPEIEDFTALLLPEDLLSENSILQAVRDNLGEEDCKDVEVIGWLYQFYISEKKDEVIGSKKKIQPEDVPAATQLFTPHWIVRYLAENSLGRLWLLNYPDSNIRELMDYYIEPVEEEEEYLEVSSPEELKICDPACGSGHMLTYAFDLLYAIYEEQGYTPSTIPSLIIEKNLYGMEISERAGHLAAFALMMKAREKDVRFFERGIKPNLCVFGNIEVGGKELERYIDTVGRDLFTSELEYTIKQFDKIENFGSLFQPSLTNPLFIKEELNHRGVPQELFLHKTHEDVKSILESVSYLQRRYDIVITNPPYMGRKYINNDLVEYGKQVYPDSYNDLFAMFIERGMLMVKNKANIAMITMQSWMFLSSFEELRRKIIKKHAILTMAHLGPRAFDTISGEVVSTTAFVLQENVTNNSKGVFVRLVDGADENQKKALLIKVAGIDTQTAPPEYYYLVNKRQFGKIPGTPIAYWVSPELRNLFENPSMKDHATLFQGIITGNNKKYLRLWYEVEEKKTAFGETKLENIDLNATHWIPYNKGGKARKWYGNHDFVVDFKNRGRDFTRGKHQFSKYFLQPCISWTYISSFSLAARYFPKGFLWDVHGSSIFPNNPDHIFYFLSLLASKIGSHILSAINPTISYQVENIAIFPILFPDDEAYKEIVDRAQKMINIAKKDWDYYELSWNFMSNPLVELADQRSSISRSWTDLMAKKRSLCLEASTVETEINRIIIELYSLGEEVDPTVLLEDVTLNINPRYRYNGDKSENELEDLLLEDTLKEFISYSVGCMFGRYSLDKPGLILGNQGDTTDTYLVRIPDPSFMPDEDNVIPVLDEGWFSDDITERFKEFLRVTFGEENFAENLDFIEKAIGRDIRSFFLKDFCEYHCKMYSKPYYGKRPIYWMFESPKGYFKALIYMHRYNKNTVSIVLNDYLREFRAKLRAQHAHLERQIENGSKQEQAKAKKELERIREMLADLKEYEDDILYPVATQQIEIDLDDGVNENYPKFGKALAPR